MPWVRFSEDYDYKFASGAVTAFKADTKVNVKKEIADAAIADGVAKETAKPEADDPEHGRKPGGAKEERHRLSFASRKDARRARRGLSGNPDPDKRRSGPLPDAADPNARRAYPLIERRMGGKVVRAHTMPVVDDPEEIQEIPPGLEPTESQKAMEEGKPKE